LLLPETALDSWHLWACELLERPVILGALSGGQSNRSLLLESAGTKLVLRLNGTSSLLPGGQRSWESVIWQAAGEQGIAPPLVYVDDQQRFLVSAFINNKLPSHPPMAREYADQALDLLKRCHSLRIVAPSIDYFNHIDRYWRVIEATGQLSNPDLIARRIPMQSVLEKLLASGSPTALCHHDPVVSNFVGDSESLYLIDWEYASTGLTIMDYAAFAVEWEADDAQVITHSGIELESLAEAKLVYRYLCDLWNEIQIRT
jgi:thiamine kinase-like enzyme